jgi:hypothetical protein
MGYPVDNVAEIGTLGWGLSKKADQKADKSTDFVGIRKLVIIGNRGNKQHE